ncbi:MAG TPA: DMT family transporter, partial [Elusimicrobiota bacterium]|nr:DMT family transporter [Elusimicrobiota bacterium]
MLKAVAGALSGTFLFSVVLSPVAEANFWQERRESLRRARADGDPHAQYAQLPASLPAADSLLPSIERLPSLPISADRQPVVGGGAFLPGSLPASLASLPAAFGELKKVALPSGKSRGWVVLVQDVHDVSSAQANIAGVLDHLSAASRGSASLLVGIEGVSGGFDLEKFRRLPDASSRRAISEYLLRAGLLTGPEHFGLTAPRAARLWGVEETSLYDRNVRAYQQSLPHRKKARFLQSRWETVLAGARDQKLPPALAEYHRRRMDYVNGRTTPVDYVRALSRLGRPSEGLANVGRFLTVLAVEDALDFSRVEKERTDLIELLSGELSDRDLADLLRESLAYRLGQISYGRYYAYLRDVARRAGIDLESLPAFKDYVRYVLVSEKIDQGGLLEEVGRWESEIVSAQKPSAEARAFLELTDDVLALSKLWSNNLNPREWGRLDERFAEIERVPARLSAFEAGGADVSAPDDAAWREMLGVFSEFYRAAAERNGVMAERFLAEFDRSVSSAGADPAFRTAVLVVGGFHAEELQKLLLRRGYACATVTPCVKEVADGTRYLSVFAGGRTPLDRLMLGDRLYLNPPSALAARMPFGFGYLKETVSRTFAALYAGLVAVRGGADLETLRQNLEKELGVRLTVQAVGEASDDYAHFTVRFNDEISFDMVFGRRGTPGEEKVKDEKNHFKEMQLSPANMVDGEVGDFAVYLAPRPMGMFRTILKVVRRHSEKILTGVTFTALLAAFAAFGWWVLGWLTSEVPMMASLQQMFVQPLAYVFRGFMTVSDIGSLSPYVSYVLIAARIGMAVVLLGSLGLAAWLVRRLSAFLRVFQRGWRRALAVPLLAGALVAGITSAGHTALDRFWIPVQQFSNGAQVRLMNIREDQRPMVLRTLEQLPPSFVRGVPSVLMSPLEEGVGGWYETDTRLMALSDDNDAAYQRTTVAHEAGHRDFFGFDEGLAGEWRALHERGKSPGDYVRYYASLDEDEDYADTAGFYVSDPWKVFDRASRSEVMQGKLVFVARRFVSIASDGSARVRLFGPGGVFVDVPIKVTEGRIDYADLAAAYQAASAGWKVHVSDEEGGAGLSEDTRSPATALAQGMLPQNFSRLQAFNQKYGKVVGLHVDPAFGRSDKMGRALAVLERALRTLKIDPAAGPVFVHLAESGAHINGQELSARLDGSSSRKALGKEIRRLLSSPEGRATNTIWREALALKKQARPQVEELLSVFEKQNQAKLGDPAWAQKYKWAKIAAYDLVETYEESISPGLEFGAEELAGAIGDLDDMLKEARKLLRDMEQTVPLTGREKGHLAVVGVLSVLGAVFWGFLGAVFVAPLRGLIRLFRRKTRTTDGVLPEAAFDGTAFNGKSAPPRRSSPVPGFDLLWSLSRGIVRVIGGPVKKTVELVLSPYEAVHKKMSAPRAPPKPGSRLWKNIFYAVLSTTVYAISYVTIEGYTKSPEFSNINSLTFAFGREAISLFFAGALLVHGLIFGAKNYRNKIQKLEWKADIRPLLLVSLAKFAVVTPLIYIAYRISSAQTLALLGLASPVFVGIYIGLLLKFPALKKHLGDATKPHLSLGIFISFLVVVSGVALMVFAPGAGNPVIKGSVLVLGIVAINSLIAVFMKKLTHQVNRLILTFLNYVMAVPIIAAVSFTGLFGNIQWSMLMAVFSVWQIWLAGLGIVLGLIFYLKSMKHGSAFFTTLLVDAWDPLITGVFTCLFLDRVTTRFEVAAFLMIFSGVSYITSRETKLNKGHQYEEAVVAQEGGEEEDVKFPFYRRLLSRIGRALFPPKARERWGVVSARVAMPFSRLARLFSKKEAAVSAAGGPATVEARAPPPRGLKRIFSAVTDRISLKTLKGVGYALLSGSFYALGYVLLEDYSHMSENVAPLSVAFIRWAMSAIVGVGVAGAWALFSKKENVKKAFRLDWKKSVRWLIYLNIFTTLLVPFQFLAFRYTTAQVIMILDIAIPLFTGFFVWFMLKSRRLTKWFGLERPGKSTWRSVLGQVAVIGGAVLVMLVGGAEAGGAKTMALMGNLFALVSVVGTAVEFIATERISRR